MPTTGPMGIAVNLINFAYLTSILVVAALMARRYGSSRRSSGDRAAGGYLFALLYRQERTGRPWTWPE